MLKYAIIGFGGLGKVHFRAYPEIKEKACTQIKLTALCDIRQSVFQSQTATNLGNGNVNLDLSDYHLYYSIDELLEKEELDFVVTALPTYLHAEVAVKILNRGIHVLSEKPMALSLEEAESMVAAAKANDRKLMIGQCCRYAGTYIQIKKMIDSGEYGKVIRAEFTRISPTPIWGWENWFVDESKSGGSILDLHVHDVDMIHYIFGMPKSVSSFATNYKAKHDSVVTRYEYDDVLVTSVGEWGCPSNTYPFQSGAFVKMEKATVELKGGKLTLYPEEGTVQEIPFETFSTQAAETIDFIDCIVHDKTSAINPAEDTLQTTRIALAEKRSADLGMPVKL